MKHLLSFFSALLLAQLLLGQEISIKGKINNYSGSDSLNVKIYSQPSPIETKVSVSKKGEFSYKYIATKTSFCYLYFSENNTITLVLSPNEDVAVTADYRNLQGTYSVKGSQQSIDLQKNMAGIMNHLNSIQNLRTVFEAKIDSVNRKITQDIATAIKQNPSNYGNLSLINSLTIDEFPDVYRLLDSALTATYPDDFIVTSFHNDIQKQMVLRVGSKIDEISLPNQKLETINLSSLRGKVVLVDFWASWCRPCRMEIPNFKKLYETYNNDGFEIYSISVDDDANAWIKALTQEQMPWANVRDVTKQYSNAYNVSAIPFTILLDAEGKIVAKGLRGAELNEQISSLLKTSYEK